MVLNASGISELGVRAQRPCQCHPAVLVLGAWLGRHGDDFPDGGLRESTVTAPSLVSCVL